MNPFFDVSSQEELPDSAFELINLGDQRPWITVGRRASDFWGTSGLPSTTTYRDTKDEDYDQQFVRKLQRWKPIYKIDHLINHHYNYYKTKNDVNPDDFLMHMRYVILPILKKRPNAEVCVELLEQWLIVNEKARAKTTYKNSSYNDIQINKVNRTVHRIHFDDLSWSDFERLIFAFVKRSRNWNVIDWLGQSGHDEGQDIWGESGDETYCYLCANYSALTLKKAKDDIDKLIKAKAIPDYLTVVCGGKVAAGTNKNIKSYAQSLGIPNVEIWSGADIEENMRIKSPELLQRFFDGNRFPE